MAVFGVGDAEKYGGQGGGGFFRLENDKDIARVRILYDGIDDVTGYAVHQVEVGDKKRYVNCLREYGDPVDKCPFCAEKKFTTVKYFVPLFNIDNDRVETWERGKKFGQKISSLCARYPHLVSHTFEIERNGKAGDQQTTYEFYETGKDENVLLDDYEIPEVLGSIVLDKSADEMNYYLDHGCFPDSAASTPVGRRQSSERTEEPVRRRTPANSGERRETF